MRNVFLCVICFCVSAALLPHPQSAQAGIELSGVVSVDGSSTNADLPAGDQFDYAMTIDDSSLLTGESGNADFFNNAITSFSITRDPGNTGTWDPSVGTYQLTPVEGFFGNNASDLVASIISGTGVPNAGGLTFDRFVFQFFLAGQDLQDVGPGDAFSDMLPGQTIDLSQLSSVSGSIQFTDGPDVFASFSVSQQSDVIPTPAAALAIPVLLGVLGLRRRRAA